MIDSLKGDMNALCTTVRVRGMGVPSSVASIVDNEYMAIGRKLVLGDGIFKVH
jgi:hypothetical protein